MKKGAYFHAPLFCIHAVWQPITGEKGSKEREGLRPSRLATVRLPKNKKTPNNAPTAKRMMPISKLRIIVNQF